MHTSCTLKSVLPLRSSSDSQAPSTGRGTNARSIQLATTYLSDITKVKYHAADSSSFHHTSAQSIGFWLTLHGLEQSLITSCITALHFAKWQFTTWQLAICNIQHGCASRPCQALGQAVSLRHGASKRRPWMASLQSVSILYSFHRMLSLESGMPTT